MIYEREEARKDLWEIASDTVTRLMAVKRVVDEQKEDAGLWIHDQQVSSVQDELRRLHRVIEGTRDILFRNPPGNQPR